METVILRSMARAVYQPRNIGHFGLALSTYAHFTSPIRRYPDLLVHRAIKHLLVHGSAKGFRYRMPEMEQLGEHCSRVERRADEAVWDVEERLKCAFLKERVGEEFEVVVASIAPFGLFVRLAEYTSTAAFMWPRCLGTTITRKRAGRSSPEKTRVSVTG